MTKNNIITPTGRLSKPAVEKILTSVYNSRQVKTLFDRKIETTRRNLIATLNTNFYDNLKANVGRERKDFVYSRIIDNDSWFTQYSPNWMNQTEMFDARTSDVHMTFLDAHLFSRQRDSDDVLQVVHSLIDEMKSKIKFDGNTVMDINDNLSRASRKKANRLAAANSAKTIKSISKLLGVLERMTTLLLVRTQFNGSRPYWLKKFRYTEAIIFTGIKARELIGAYFTKELSNIITVKTSKPRRVKGARSSNTHAIAQATLTAEIRTREMDWVRSAIPSNVESIYDSSYDVLFGSKGSRDAFFREMIRLERETQMFGYVRRPYMKPKMQLGA